MKRKKYTLLELLVIVAIIMILLALLLPSLQRAREMGKRMGCLGSIRQIGLCWNTYASEFRGHIYPNTHPGYGTFESTSTGFPKLYGGARLLNAMKCPSAVIRTSYGNSAHYAYNFDRLKNMTWDQNPMLSYAGLLNRIKSPQKKLAFCDYGTDKNINTSYGALGGSIPIINYIPGAGCYAPAASILSSTSSSSTWNVTHTNNRAFFNDFMNGRHLNSISVLYADGHAGSMTALEVARQFYPCNNPAPAKLFSNWTVE